MRWLFLIALVGCYKDPSFGDCEVACTTTCPGDLQCIAGACRVAGAMGQCTVMPGGDAGSGSGDRDADGVPDAVDNCPDNPNPKQGDEDGDMIGDVCDPCPVDQSTADPDGDGIAGMCDVLSGSGDAIALFDGFTGDPTQATPTQGGNGVWSMAGGVAVATNANGALATLLWPAKTTGSAYVFAQFQVTQVTGAPVIGVVDLTMGATSGTGCVLGRSTTAMNITAVYDIASDTNLSRTNAPPWMTNTTYGLLLTRKVGGSAPTIYCTDSTGTASAPAGAVGPSWGLYVAGADAKFDYIMVVTAP